MIISVRVVAMIALMLCLGACATKTSVHKRSDRCHSLNSPKLVLEPGDRIGVFVWGQSDAPSYTIRPDGRFSMPLIEDVPASGKTPSALAHDIEIALSRYIDDPIVSVIPLSEATRTSGLDPQCSITVIGQAATPRSVRFRRGITVLDVIIAVGGLTDLADGNSAVLERQDGREKISNRLRLDDLVRKSDISVDRPLAPGDRIIIPRVPAGSRTRTNGT